MAITELELAEFCAKEEQSKYRTWLCKPFSGGQYSYATTGQYAVRVPRIASIPECSEKTDAPSMLDKAFVGASSAGYTPVGEIKLPDLVESKKESRCDDCDGSGKEHDCPDCECDCPACDGTGMETHLEKISVKIFGLIFRLPYIQKILSLPGVQHGQPPKDGEAMLFRFDGGEAAIMPMTTPCRHHIDLVSDTTISIRDQGSAG